MDVTDSPGEQLRQLNKKGPSLFFLPTTKNKGTFRIICIHVITVVYLHVVRICKWEMCQPHLRVMAYGWFSFMPALFGDTLALRFTSLRD